MRSTALTFELPAAAQATLRVYEAPGRHQITWDGAGEGGARLPAGAYLLDLRAGKVQVARKVTLLAPR